MSKFTKLQRSQKAHRRLNRKYLNSDNTAKNRTYCNYHAYVHEIQQKRGKILPKAERSKIFKETCRYENYIPQNRKDKLIGKRGIK